MCCAHEDLASLTYCTIAALTLLEISRLPLTKQDKFCLLVFEHIRSECAEWLIGIVSEVVIHIEHLKFNYAT
jgi:hypothetical protein